MGGVSNSNLALKYKAKIFFEANAFTSFFERMLKRLLHNYLFIQLYHARVLNSGEGGVSLWHFYTWIFDAEINLSIENECYKL